MSVLISNFLTQNYSSCFYRSLPRYDFEIKDCSFFIASEVCSDWVSEYNVSRLKNKCIDAARILDVDWLVMMPGIDCSLVKMPELENLDDEAFYFGRRVEHDNDIPHFCSLHLLPRKVYKNYKYDEFYRFYWDDFDYFYNVTKDVDKKENCDFLCFHEKHNSLISSNDLIRMRFQKEKEMFYLKYEKLYGSPFPERE